MKLSKLMPLGFLIALGAAGDTNCQVNPEAIPLPNKVLYVGNSDYYTATGRDGCRSGNYWENPSLYRELQVCATIEVTGVTHCSPVEQNACLRMDYGTGKGAIPSTIYLRCLDNRSVLWEMHQDEMLVSDEDPNVVEWVCSNVTPVMWR